MKQRLNFFLFIYLFICPICQLEGRSMIEPAKEPDLSVEALAERIKALESKVNTRVIFSVVRKGLDEDRYPNKADLGEIITYTDVIANVGQGMDPNTGVFEAPVSGIYSFSFSALSDTEKSTLSGFKTSIEVIKNLQGDYLDSRFYIYQDNGTQEFFENLSFSWMMSLTKGDRIHLAMAKYGTKLLTTDNYPLYFNGQLLESV